MAPTLITVTGSLYHPSTGQKITSGKLIVRPKNFIRSNGELVSASPVEYSIPGTGNLSFQLVPSGGVSYVVEFDPNPADTGTPLKLKSGYWTNVWTIPGTGPVDISTL